MHDPLTNRRVGLLGLAVLLLASDHVAAQEPQLYPPWAPQWQVDIESNSMVLSPETANLALGTSQAATALQVLGDNVTAAPGTGYVTLGPTSSLHMQLDRNDLRVAGSTNTTFGALYLQRYGGPIVVHGSKPLDSRLYVTTDGDIGVATSNPRQFALDRELVGPGWTRPPGELAVDGDVYAERVSTLEAQFLDSVRIGRSVELDLAGAAFDLLHVDALLQVAGKISAQQIVVHLAEWSDDVFDDDYALMPLGELEAYVQRERHLPEVPSEDEVLAHGSDLAQTNAILLRKIEELTLHTIAQQKQIDELERRIDALASDH